MLLPAALNELLGRALLAAAFEAAGVLFAPVELADRGLLEPAVEGARSFLTLSLTAAALLPATELAVPGRVAWREAADMLLLNFIGRAEGSRPEASHQVPEAPVAPSFWLLASAESLPVAGDAVFVILGPELLAAALVGLLLHSIENVHNHLSVDQVHGLSVCSYLAV